jgi:hypothetical protein
LPINPPESLDGAGAKNVTLRENKDSHIGTLSELTVEAARELRPLPPSKVLFDAL